MCRLKVTVVEIMLRPIVQIAAISVRIVIRAIGKSLKEEISMFQETAKKRDEWAKVNENKILTASTSLTLEDAMKILNVDKLDPEKIRKNYEHIFVKNDTAKGSTLYLQSKIFRAKERIDLEMISKEYKSFKEE